MFFTMIVALYTSRVVLQVLGASDYGLYNVIGGILTMFTMFSTSLTIGTQRFLTFALGENNFEKLQRVFSMALALHTSLAIIIFILSETVGLWFFYQYLNIPEGRMTAAFWVYQFTVLGFMVSLVQVPFQSCIISHEKMSVYAYMGIYDAIMKLILVMMLQFISYDKLIVYAVLIFGVNLSSILLYNIYCRRHFEECSFNMSWDTKLAKDFSSYCGWNLIGGSYGFFTNQGINILLNIFCGTLVNAARGISMTINGFVTTFVSNFQVVVNPQIVKLYAAKELDRLYSLIINSCRISEYLYLIVAIPIFIEIEFVLKLWLVDYPPYTPAFVQIILIQSAWAPVNHPIGMLIHATGKMKWTAIWTGGIILIFPITYILLKMGYSPVTVHIVSAIMWLYINACNLYFAHRYVGISIAIVLKRVYVNVIIGAFIMFIVPFYISNLLDIGWIRFLTVSFVSLFTSVIVISLWGMTPGMRNFVFHKLHIKS